MRVPQRPQKVPPGAIWLPQEGQFISVSPLALSDKLQFVDDFNRALLTDSPRQTEVRRTLLRTLRLIRVRLIFHPRRDAGQFPVLDPSPKLLLHRAFEDEFVYKHHHCNDQEEQE